MTATASRNIPLSEEYRLNVWLRHAQEHRDPTSGTLVALDERGSDGWLIVMDGRDVRPSHWQQIRWMGPLLSQARGGIPSAW